MSTGSGVRLCGSGCSATPHIASKTASKRFGGLQGWFGSVRAFSFFLIAVVDVLLVREFQYAEGRGMSRARGVEWPRSLCAIGKIKVALARSGFRAATTHASYRKGHCSGAKF
jgi:hypothetical protein